MKQFLILIFCALGLFSANAAVNPPGKAGPECQSYSPSADQSPAFVIELISVQAPESPAVCFQTIGSPDLIGLSFLSYSNFASTIDSKPIILERGWNKRISYQSQSNNISLIRCKPCLWSRGWNKRISCVTE